jgi:hypothetical protein
LFGYEEMIMVFRMPTRARLGFTGLTATAAVFAVGVVAPQSAFAAAVETKVPGAPTDLSAVRSSSDVRDFKISWKKPPGPVDHYVVSMFADGKRSSVVVPKTRKYLDVDGNGLMTIYQVQVTAENAASLGSSSDELTVNPVLSGPPANVLGAVRAGGGIRVSWTRPARTGLNPVLSYRVTVTDQATHTSSVNTAAATATSIDLPNLDAGRAYEVAVAAMTRDGAGLTETGQVGGTVPTAPRWFTAVRDPQAPGQVVLSWTAPSWPGSSPVTGYEVNANGTWTSVGTSTDATLSLPATATGTYTVRAVNATGNSAAADSDFVDTTVRTPLVSSAYPISVTASGHDVTVNLHNKLATSQDQLTVRLLPAAGWTYRDERTIANGAELAVSFDGVPSGRYRLSVIGRNTKNTKDTGSDLYNEEVFVNDGALTMSSVDVSFAEGTQDWHGVYPTTSLPIVIMTDKVAYDGSTSMAITARKDSVGQNIAASPGIARAIPTAAGRQLVVSAQGYATSGATQWNLGVAWYNAKGEKIAVTRTKRLSKTAGDWKASAGTFTTPAGAVNASTFVEVGELLRGQTFYVDDVSLRSYTPRA